MLLNSNAVGWPATAGPATANRPDGGALFTRTTVMYSAAPPSLSNTRTVIVWSAGPCPNRNVLLALVPLSA